MLSRSREWAIAQMDGNCEKGYTFWLIGFAKQGQESSSKASAESSSSLESYAEPQLRFSLEKWTESDALSRVGLS
jgi:hypothetical protein